MNLWSRPTSLLNNIFVIPYMTSFPLLFSCFNFYCTTNHFTDCNQCFCFGFGFNSSKTSFWLFLTSSHSLNSNIISSIILDVSICHMYFIDFLHCHSRITKSGMSNFKNVAILFRWSSKAFCVPPGSMHVTRTLKLRSSRVSRSELCEIAGEQENLCVL